jgi:hypothetical protein
MKEVAFVVNLESTPGVSGSHYLLFEIDIMDLANIEESNNVCHMKIPLKRAKFIQSSPGIDYILNISSRSYIAKSDLAYEDYPASSVVKEGLESSFVLVVDQFNCKIEDINKPGFPITRRFFTGNIIKYLNPDNTPLCSKFDFGKAMIRYGEYEGYIVDTNGYNAEGDYYQVLFLNDTTERIKRSNLIRDDYLCIMNRSRWIKRFNYLHAPKNNENEGPGIILYGDRAGEVVKVIDSGFIKNNNIQEPVYIVEDEGDTNLFYPANWIHICDELSFSTESGFFSNEINYEKDD